MPRKRSAEGKPVDVSGVELRAVRVELTPDVHKRLRLAAADEDMSMAALVRRLVEQYLAKPKRGKG